LKEKKPIEAAMVWYGLVWFYFNNIVIVFRESSQDIELSEMIINMVRIHQDKV